MFKITKSNNLKGEINVSGSKNAALPILAANFIIDQKIKIKNLPNILDITTLKDTFNIALQNSKDFFNLNTPETSKIRASILLIPYGLLKYGEVHFCKPGGCNIGKRPLDAFDDAFIQAGVKIENKGYKIYKQINKPKSKIILQEFSVTTTEALITYLSFLENIDYEIKIYNIAIEPHIINLIEFLKLLGAKIKLHYNHSISILPSKINIKAEEFKIIGDYIEAGTFLGLGAIAENSELIIKGCNIEDLISTFKTADRIGINIEILDNETFKVNSKNKNNYKAIKLQTMIFPGFPTDLQSIFGVVLTQANGISKIFETLFEGRFNYLTELENLGANVEILSPHQALIIGPSKLKGGYITTKDLRGGGALILAGTIAEGETYIMNEDIILRGYENILGKLRSIGVNIEKV